MLAVQWAAQKPPSRWGATGRCWWAMLLLSVLIDEKAQKAWLDAAGGSGERHMAWNGRDRSCHTLPPLSMGPGLTATWWQGCSALGCCWHGREYKCKVHGVWISSCFGSVGSNLNCVAGQRAARRSSRVVELSRLHLQSPLPRRLRILESIAALSCMARMAGPYAEVLPRCGRSKMRTCAALAWRRLANLSAVRLGIPICPCTLSVDMPWS